MAESKTSTTWGYKGKLAFQRSNQVVHKTQQFDCTRWPHKKKKKNSANRKWAHGNLNFVKWLLNMRKWKKQAYSALVFFAAFIWYINQKRFKHFRRQTSATRAIPPAAVCINRQTKRWADLFTDKIKYWLIQDTSLQLYIHSSHELDCLWEFLLST